MRILIFTILISMFMVCTSLGQSVEKVELKVNRVSESIHIDGVLDELSWNNAQAASPFFNKWPLDSGYADSQTSVKMLFDNEFIFISAINYQKKNELVIQTLKRDQPTGFWASDGFCVVLDPINQKSTGFLFGVNAGGAQFEGAITLDGSWSTVNENWDNKWFSAVKVYDEYWTVEIAIPFTALRFKNKADTWGLNFIRNYRKDNIYSTWSQVPLQFPGVDLGYLGSLRWAEQITPKKSKVTLIPYASSGISKDHEEFEDTENMNAAGIDVKVSLTSSMNLDLTYKPDFSNVEVDRQMTNMTRFSLLFPERRSFFLENADLFTNFGTWMVKPFFSRKIGLYDGDPVPIMAGARLSGNLTKGLRIGIMDIQTEATEKLSANNYLVAAFQQQLFARSSIRFFGANRETTLASEGDTEDDYNRTYGSEFQYISKDGKWSGNLRAHEAYTPARLNQNEYLSSQLNFVNSKMYAGATVEKVGENYVNDFGFVPRLYNEDPIRDTMIRIGHYTFNPWFGLLIYPKKSKRINLIEPNTWSIINYRTSGRFLERNTSVNLGITFKDTRMLYFEVANTDANIPFAADILDNNKPIPVGRYRFTQYTFKYTADSRRIVSGDANVTYGHFYNGTRLEYGASVNYRIQPWGLFSLSYLQNEVWLSDEYGSATFQLICQRTELSLRNNLWWTIFLQYNTQDNNININSRLQWRYKPMSDLFLVYSDNYTADHLKVKNRGVVVKLTYWLNL